MKHLFVPHHIARLLKEKGFDEECFRYINDKDDYIYSFENNDNFEKRNNTELAKKIHHGYITLPLYQQTVNWFRKKNIQLIELPTSDNTKTPRYFVVHKGENKGAYELDKSIEEALKLV